MAGGNKKKKKPASNPARGFTTTSLQSKSKIENAKEIDSTDASAIATPDSTPTPAIPETSGTDQKRDILELSPEELETQLELSELQQFVETHASKVKKDASRQVTRLQTDKRLLRGQAEFLSVKQWLPEELVLQVLEYTAAEQELQSESTKNQSLALGDDLVAKIWNLRLVLIDLDVSVERVTEVISFILQLPSSDDSPGQTWGLQEALDWLALNCTTEELQDYDSARKLAIFSADDADANDFSPERSEGSAEDQAKKHDSPQNKDGKTSADSSLIDEIDVSDIGSDLEPDELLSVHLRTKARLYEINPANDEFSGKRKKGAAKSKKNQDHSGETPSAGQRKLQQKLRKIESDVLFDQREADAQWAAKEVGLAQQTAQRKKLNLSTEHESLTQNSTNQASSQVNQTNQVADEAEKLGDQVLEEAEHLDDDNLLVGMFDALPGTSHAAVSNGVSGQEESVTIRDFGRVTGMTPRRILEETCRSRDPRCKIGLRQESPTTYACRHSVIIDWTKDQGVHESSYLKSISVRSRPRQLVVTMIREATPDVSQSESYVATAALFVLFSGSPKEEKAHLRLPPSYRDLWNELLELKREHIDAADRGTVKELRSLIEKQTRSEDDPDDEVVFNASSRRLNGVASGASTPATRPQTPKFGISPASQSLKDIWSQKFAAPSYQRMLIQRMNLPMFHSKAAAIETIEKNQVTIVVGDTGSGKSTQLPQFLLENELSNGRDCKIYCTQPRRISAISLAQRVSEELGENKGDLGTARSLIGYAIRLESHSVLQTKLIYATVGIVLRMLENSNGLDDITHLVLDEVHERNIDTDFLLIVLQSLILKRPELKVVLMSATVDAQKFSKYLNNAPIISVPGRTFPVTPLFLEDAIELTKHTIDDVHGQIEDDDNEPDSSGEKESGAKQDLSSYSPKTRATLAKYEEYKIDFALIVKLLEFVAYNGAYQKFSRAILIFVPGIQEIRQLHDMLLGHQSFSQSWRVHALHSTFSSEDQQAAFDIPPEGVRKIVIATNIAETGITIPDITCVVDTGKHREMRFDERRQMSKLTQSFIAKANAKQRRGRAGRVQEGICFHLFTKHRFEELMAEQQTPEMLRLSLQDLVMRVKICKLGDIADALSQALDPPSSKNVRRAIDALIEVGALTENEQLTTLGSQLAKLPLDAQLGKLILYGVAFRCLDFALMVAAALGSKSPFLSPMHAKKQADSVRLGFKRGDSDILTLYNAYSTWKKVCTTPGLSEYQFCNKNFLSAQNLGNIEDLKAQLLISLVDAGFVTLAPNERAALMRVRPGSRQRHFVTLPDKYCSADGNDIVASSVVAWSFYPKIIKQDGRGWRNIANNQSLGLHPTSVNKHGLSPDVKYLSFYSIMQSSSKFTNAQETTPATDFALVLLAGEAVFHMYAGVIVIDGNRLRFKVKDWKTMIVLKYLRAKVRDALGRQFKYPGRELGDRHRRWLELLERIFDYRNGREMVA